MAIELFYMGLDASSRAMMMLVKKLGLDVKYNHVDLKNPANIDPEFYKENPFRAVPALKDNDFNLYESRAIMVYLVNKYAPESALYPKDIQQRALVDAMLDFDLGSIITPLQRRLALIYNSGQAESEVILERNRKNLKLFDDLLSTRKYAAGDHLTLADISIVHSLTLAEVIDDDLSNFVHLSNYLKRVKEELGQDYIDINDSNVKEFQSFVRSKKSS